MRSYRRVTYEDRCQIKAYLDANIVKGEIARRLGFHKSTIGREIRRNSEGSYFARAAEALAKGRFVLCRKPLKVTGPLRVMIEGKLGEYWSPEQISGRLKLEERDCVSREAIYRFIRSDKKNAGSLWKALRRPPRKG